MIAAITVLSRWLHLPIRVLHSIAQMRKTFHVLYLFNFDTALARRKLLWYKNHITKVLSFSNYFISYIEKHRSMMIMDSMLEKGEGQTIFINYEMSQVHFLNQEDCGNTVEMLRSTKFS